MTIENIPTRVRRRKRKPLPARTRFRILNRDGFRCRYCGATAKDDRLHVDHVDAVSKGGSDNDDNLVTACATCNLGKFTDDLECQEERFRTGLWRALYPVRRGTGRDASRLNLLDIFLCGESVQTIGEIATAATDDDDVDRLLAWLSAQGAEE